MLRLKITYINLGLDAHMLAVVRCILGAFRGLVMIVVMKEESEEEEEQGRNE